MMLTPENESERLPANDSDETKLLQIESGPNQDVPLQGSSTEQKHKTEDEPS